ncbi:MAG: M28 family peptidase [Chthoniobacterales bacterium]|nr:M28 family peptidase [Chthoniobacterales bacterium]
MRLTRFLSLVTLGKILAIAIAANGGVGTNGDQTLSRNTPEKLVAAIQLPALWQHLSDFQTIADEHPDSSGHGNRDTGTAGYRASVDYVANMMKQAGYKVTIQSYPYGMTEVMDVPQLTVSGRHYPVEQDWVVARLSGGGVVTAPIHRVTGSGTGSSAEEFATFPSGAIALLQRGGCAYDIQVANAEQAGASAVILFDPSAEHAARGKRDRSIDGSQLQIPRLTRQAKILVVAVASTALANDLLGRIDADEPPVATLEIHTQIKSGVDYNVIADSPFGDPDRVVIVDAHLDSIYGAGILDNASGSSTILEIALQMAKTPTRNQLRYVWFGGEEIGLLGSAYYTKNLTPAERGRIAFDIDVDVTATPNFDYLVADPKFAFNVKRFPANVVPESEPGNQSFANYFASRGVPSRSAPFGNDGTDSNSFSLIGIPNTGILTQQDCCKGPQEVAIWGGFLGNYEGKIPSFDGGCVDRPHHYCDNLYNNDPTVLELVSQATAYVTLQLANHPFAADK